MLEGTPGCLQSNTLLKAGTSSVFDQIAVHFRWVLKNLHA